MVICFLCKKEFGQFTFQKYRPTDLKYYQKHIPKNMTDDDVVCHDCYKSLKFTEKHERDGKIMKYGLLIGFLAVMIYVSLVLGLPCPVPREIRMIRTLSVFEIIVTMT